MRQIDQRVSGTGRNSLWTNTLWTIDLIRKKLMFLWPPHPVRVYNELTLSFIMNFTLIWFTYEYSCLSNCMVLRFHAIGSYAIMDHVSCSSCIHI
jgi:hypothetical protein